MRGLMRNVLGRLVFLLAFWFGFLDLFVGRTKGQWIWTVWVIVAFLLAESTAKLILFIYLKRGEKESGR
jgi:hypothetical protein